MDVCACVRVCVRVRARAARARVHAHVCVCVRVRAAERGRMAGECAGLVRDVRGLWAEWHAVSEAGLPDGVLPELLLRCRRATRPGPLSDPCRVLAAATASSPSSCSGGAAPRRGRVWRRTRGIRARPLTSPAR